MSYTCDLFGFAVSDVTEIVGRYYEVCGMILPVRTAEYADKAVGKLCGTLLGNELNSHSIFSSLTLRRLMSYIYGAPILDVSRSHTTTQHSR